MIQNEVVENEQPLALAPMAQQWAVEISDAPQVRLQTLDLVRHVAFAPDGKRYVVGTFDDRRLRRGFVTAVFPQQNGYLTLIRLTICEMSSETEEQAVQKHIEVVKMIQQGKLHNLVKSLTK